MRLDGAAFIGVAFWVDQHDICGVVLAACIGVNNVVDGCEIADLLTRELCHTSKAGIREGVDKVASTILKVNTI